MYVYLLKSLKETLTEVNKLKQNCTIVIFGFINLFVDIMKTK